MRFIYCIYQLFVAAPIIILSTIITAIITAVGSTLGSAHFWGYYPGRIWSKIICRILLLPIKVEGRGNIDPKKSYVIVANHQGAMDIFLIYGYLGRNFKWMMKKSLRKMPFVGIACEKARHIFVDRSGPKAIEATLIQARDTLKDGTSLVVFPEGHRTFTGKMNTFKKGAFLLAKDIPLPIVPVTIDGSFDVLPRTKGLNFVHRHMLKLIIHQPIDSSDLEKAMEQSFKTIEDSLTPQNAT